MTPTAEPDRPPCAGCGHRTARGGRAFRTMHCASPTCTWWACGACKALNDLAGRWLPGNGAARPPRRPTEQEG